MGDVDSAKVRDFHAPENLAIVGIERHESVESLMIHSPIGRKRSGHAGLSINTKVGTGPANPLELQLIDSLSAAKAFVGVGGV